VQSFNGKNQLKRAYQTCLMKFDYWMNATNGSLNVIIRYGSSSLDYVYRLRGNQGNKWNKASVSIYSQRAPFTVELVASYPLQNSGQSDVIAIDDISYENCGLPAIPAQCDNGKIKCQSNNRCIDPNVLCDGLDDCGDAWDESQAQCQKLNVSRCSLDTEISNCQLTFESNGGPNANWIYTNSISANLNRNTGPVTDHTFRRLNSGSFLAVRGNAATFGKTMRVLTHMVTTVSGKTCALRFFYYMYGNSMGTLSAYARYANRNTSSVLFTKSGNFGQLWNRAIVVINDSVKRSFQFVIEAQMTNSSLADIAIDDLSFSEGCVISNETPLTTTTTAKTTTSTAKTSITTTSGTNTNTANTNSQSTKPTIRTNLVNSDQTQSNSNCNY
jgi:hypothetical protein